MLTTTFHPLKQLLDHQSAQEVVQELWNRERGGLISVQKMDRFEQYTYTKDCQFEKKWDPYTLIARGLIFDTRHQQFYCTYPKFFNYSELEPSQRPGTSIVEVSNKYDGSLIIAWFDWDTTEWRFATKGSFQSDQAQWAAKWFAEKPIDLHPGVTYLFEAIYPENQIVVRYDWVGLVFIGAYRNNGLHEINLEEHLEGINLHNRYKIRETYPVSSLELIPSLVGRKNFEGVVVKYSCGTRVKFKSEEYCLLHKLVTGVTKRRVWELLYNEMTSNPNDMSISEWKKNVPEEFWPEVDNWANGFITETKNHIYVAELLFPTLPKSSRKEFALEVLKTTCPIIRSVLFMMLDGKTDRLDQKVMEMLKP